MRMIGVDVGGTFTDIIYVQTHRGHSTGTTFVHKTPTTPANPARGVIDGVMALCERHDVAPESLDYFMHGTTIATNSVLEYQGARTAMLTNEGYRDVLHIGRHQRPQHYSIMQEIPWQDRPLVQRRYRKTVAGRLVPPYGKELVALDEAAVADIAQQLKRDNIEAIAICFLFSYLNSAHEERARQIIEAEFPQCFVTTSNSVSPQFREFERFTTAAMNAFIGPRVRDYIDELDRGLKARGVNAKLQIMGSNGGAASAARVRDQPILTLLSGPAAGVLGGAWSGSVSGSENLVTFDVGGTSADIGIVVDGEFSEATARDTWIGGYPVLAPMIDIHTIGAGGGSVAYLDAGGGMRVGPSSAGAIPGPAAYGHGGDQPTVTDAEVVLGRLRSAFFLGGAMALDEVAARRVIGAFADAASMSIERAAAGILTIVTANMANAIRSKTVQKGLDPRDFSLVAFGGAGPLSAVAVARLLDIPTVIIPPFPGLTSAQGLLTTDLRYDAVRTEFTRSDKVDCERLDANFSAMHTELTGRFDADDTISFKRSGDLRYEGQGYELRIAFPDDQITPAAVAHVFEEFHEAHRAEYGHAFTDSVIELVNIRVTASRTVPKIPPPTIDAAGSAAAALLDTAPCYFEGTSVDEVGAVAPLATRFFERAKLPPDTSLDGPAIVVQTDSTTVIPPGARFTADRAGNLVIDTGVAL
ncbi:MAG: hydantoinase/oxoprolinase family protein [Gammaproteobacteria bacterium]|nr:hydantoinase/oxoprolinase family protein [Gammaproteobacteria bacterium]